MTEQQAETIIKLLKKTSDRMLGLGVLLLAVLGCCIVLVIRALAVR
jgi:hypothetical protein